MYYKLSKNQALFEMLISDRYQDYHVSPGAEEDSDNRNKWATGHCEEARVHPFHCQSEIHNKMPTKVKMKSDVSLAE